MFGKFQLDIENGDADIRFGDMYLSIPNIKDYCWDIVSKKELEFCFAGQCMIITLDDIALDIQFIISDGNQPRDRKYLTFLQTYNLENDIDDFISLMSEIHRYSLI